MTGERKDEGELERALKSARDAGRADPDEADIAADDAGGTRLAEELDEERREER